VYDTVHSKTICSVKRNQRRHKVRMISRIVIKRGLMYLGKCQNGFNSVYVYLLWYIIRQHVLRYHPQVSHYRREHAPNRRYLPNDLTVCSMHDNYLEEFPDKPCSYETYNYMFSGTVTSGCVKYSWDI